MNENIWALGSKLKKIRKDEGATLEAVAEQMGCSSAFLSMLENGRSGISYSNLQKLLKIYHRTMADLVDKPDHSGRLVHLASAPELGYNFEGVEALLLAQDVQNKVIIPAYFRVQPKCSIGPMQHVGEEFCFVIEGSFEVTLTDPETGRQEKFNVDSGDTLYYESSLLHTWVNTGDKVGIFLGAGSPPSF
ncbi:helix-turn-helix domain-containing protein [Papillibacter cinnamivorans]|uniref:Helix-turn-helix domain-containing protein n=1 Tax=Papillibacter cinnamivorans DSM 12816 TaxID=1122930 RepID=A0A1W2CBQ1_9FIRM|nr:XRE family transcriptional regulator [Papillibacter cinnamivorans]SMC82551.1 Helix-turn-helix domain-containing protein [Papillibacter cinnamivorans DSM 12816]